MSTLKTGLCSLAIAAAGVGALAWATHGFQAYTREGLLRLSVQQAPRPLPSVALQGADGQTAAWPGTRPAGQWIIAGFMYTHCATVCRVQGSEFTQLQALLQPQIRQGRVRLISISFDPARDTPAALARYLLRHDAAPGAWDAARPARPGELAALLDAFGVQIIPDGLGGFEHNAAFNLIDPQGRLAAILDWDDPQAAADYVLARQ
ncbi:SCO family protein [Castellaniella hirudinis]|uniref:SCO family protein n=1 Tax=Castellaniella hirudinis TaxID=1144617 RepID=UPI0039C3F191